MNPCVWAITGIKSETVDSEQAGILMSDRITGRLNQTWETIMHGDYWVDEFEFPSYAYLHASFQKMEDFESMPVAERGLGAVSGGFTSSTCSAYSDTLKIVQEWGVIDKSNAHFLCRFESYHHSTGTMYNSVMVCFDRTNVAPVSGFWRNSEVMVGPNIQGDKTDWGVTIESGRGTGCYAVALEKVESTVVLKVEFPEVSADGDGETKTVELEVMSSQTFTNGSSATAKDTFNLKTTLLDTHTFAFEEGLDVDWSTEWKVKVPLLSEAKTTVEVDVPFEAHQACATSKTQTIDRSAEISLVPMTGVKAKARYTKSVLAVNAVLTVQKTYTNGAIQTSKVPAKYTSVSRDNVEIRLESVPVVPTSIE